MNRTQYWHMVGAWVFLFSIVVPYQSVWSQQQEITFSVTGDIPYNPNQVLVFQEQVANHKRYSPSAFFVHVGDIFVGGEPCSDSAYSLMANMLKGLAVPVFIVPGDNETIDCSNPAEGLNIWKTHFQNFEQNFCGAPAVEHQSTHPENFAFMKSGVLFVGINMVGGNSPYQPDANWVSEQLQSKGSQVRAAVIFSHVKPDHSTQFSTPFRQAAAAFGKPVLFLHGHGHAWSTGYPFPEQNILRVQVDNGAAEDPVEVTVTTAETTNPDSMFIFKRDPWSSEIVHNMPPCVEAGPDQTIFITSTATLQGQATDDGDPNPPGALAVAWSQVSGPGTVTFENASDLATTASFSMAGTYILRLTANDGTLQNSDELTVIVKGQIVHQETQTGGSSSSMTVATSADLTGVNGHLYLAAISTQPKKSVVSVTGLGLTWTLVKDQCSGLNTTGVEVWKAQGMPSGNGVVTATLASASTATVITASRYSGADLMNPIGNMISGNTNGANTSAVCSGGVASNSYSFNLATTVNDAMVYCAVAIKSRTHTPGAGYTERAEIKQVGGSLTSAIAVEDKMGATAGTVTVDGSLSGTADWAEVGLEIKPQTGGPVQYTLTVNTVGSGSVTLDPVGGTYDAGTEVTLTATLGSGFQFSGWSGDLSGSTNPATITIDGNKNVTATFTTTLIVHEETQAGGSSSSTTVATSADLTGVNGHLYLAAISTQPKKSVVSVTGLGLTWTLVKNQCSGL
ncbi:MAG: InlB B-repeat-containing protein, partial [bacterium]